MKHFRLVAVMVAAMLAACTLVHIEGNSNTVSDIEGHTGALKVPPPSTVAPLSQ